jgi:hypothetical protein
MAILKPIDTVSELQARVAQLEAQLVAKNKINFKVSEKGAVSVLGLQRFPVTLYASQWERLAAEMDKLMAFIAANQDKVTRKAA